MWTTSIPVTCMSNTKRPSYNSKKSTNGNKWIFFYYTMLSTLKVPLESKYACTKHWFLYNYLPKFKAPKDLISGTSHSDQWIWWGQLDLLGTSSFGLVYKGVLKDGTVVAVKVLQLQNDQGEKSLRENAVSCKSFDIEI